MINLKQKNKCCGCTACQNICPQNAIIMNNNEEGFLFPDVMEDRCIECHLCEKVCLINAEYSHVAPLYVLACSNKDINLKMRSSSGGIFALVARDYLSNEGIVYGAKFDNKYKVIHTEVNDDIEKFYGSKYVQSNMKFTYKNIANDLKQEKKVLFVGTPCQVAGLNNYLALSHISQENLLKMDFICHGVPSPTVLEKYLLNLEKKYNSEIKNISFRDKTYGWTLFSIRVEFCNGSVYLCNLNEDPYLQGFLKNLDLRLSCYNCQANNFKSRSDLTLGDYWGGEKLLNEPEKGISFLSINTSRGQIAFDNISDNLFFVESTLEHAKKYNPCLVRSVKMNNKRNDFFKEIEKCSDVDKLLKKYTKKTIQEKLLSCIKEIYRYVKK